MIVQALLLWLVVYVSFLAVGGFAILIVRGFGGRDWPYSAVLRASSGIALVLSTIFWVAVLILA